VGRTKITIFVSPVGTTGAMQNISKVQQRYSVQECDASEAE